MKLKKYSVNMVFLGWNKLPCGADDYAEYENVGYFTCMSKAVSAFIQDSGFDEKKGYISITIRSEDNNDECN